MVLTLQRICLCLTGSKFSESEEEVFSFPRSLVVASWNQCYSCMCDARPFLLLRLSTSHVEIGTLDGSSAVDGWHHWRLMISKRGGLEESAVAEPFTGLLSKGYTNKVVRCIHFTLCIFIQSDRGRTWSDALKVQGISWHIVPKPYIGQELYSRGIEELPKLLGHASGLRHVYLDSVHPPSSTAKATASLENSNMWSKLNSSEMSIRLGAGSVKINSKWCSIQWTYSFAEWIWWFEFSKLLSAQC